MSSAGPLGPTGQLGALLGLSADPSNWSGMATLEWPAVGSGSIEPSHDTFDFLRDFGTGGNYLISPYSTFKRVR